MEMRSRLKLHSSESLAPGKENPALIGEILEAVWTLGLLCLPGVEPWSSRSWPASVLTALPVHRASSEHMQKATHRELEGDVRIFW